MNLGSLYATLGVDTTGLDMAMVKMKTFEASSTASLKRIGTRLESTGRFMSMYLTVPLLGAGAAALKTSMDFETSMAHVEGLVGVARDQVELWMC